MVLGPAGIGCVDIDPEFPVCSHTALRAFSPVTNNMGFVENVVKGIENTNENTSIMNEYTNPVPPPPPHINNFLNRKIGSYQHICVAHSCSNNSCPAPEYSQEANCTCLRWKLIYVRH